MKILIATSEAVPYAKTGGLADAVSALSLALAQLGHQVRLVMPRYYCVKKEDGLVKLEGAMGVPMGGGEEWCAVHTAAMPNSPEKNPVTVYFIDHENFFGRDGIYGSREESDYMDNPQRYAFFCRSIFQLCRKLDWYPEVIHANDWPTALVPVFLKYQERAKEFSHTASVLTIHNLGYQGIYGKDNFNYTNLGWDVFFNAGFDDWNMMNLLKAGILSADKLNTVSPNYARETRTSSHGFRLNSVLSYRGDDYIGILNGIDRDLWNPAIDPYIPQHYTEQDLSGKRLAKEELQKRFSLPPTPDIPIIGMVTRLTDQKGVGELFGPSYGALWEICRKADRQFVILGTGESWCEHEIRNLSARLSNFKAIIGYDEEVSHLITAGSDFFLMPSRYEPCGLNQMYALNYGTLPIVRNTGGLADTVENFNQENGSGTGFIFDDLTPTAIEQTVDWAVWAYYNRSHFLESMRIRGMKQDFSWEKSAKKYVSLYASSIESLQQGNGGVPAIEFAE